MCKGIDTEIATFQCKEREADCQKMQLYKILQSVELETMFDVLVISEKRFKKRNRQVKSRCITFPLYICVEEKPTVAS